VTEAAVAIVGIGDTPVGRVADLSAQGLYELASTRAIVDAGLERGEIDGVLTASSRTSPYQNHAEALAESLGIAPRLTLTFGTGGATTLKMIALAAWAIRAGAARRVLVAAADNLLTGLGGASAVRSLADTGYREFERPYAPFAPVTFALLAQRHAHELGSRPEDLATVAVTLRANAARTPGAQFRDSITVADVLGSPLIASPLRRLDCAPVSDGGGALVVAGADVAPSIRHAPVWVLGNGEAHQEFLPYAPELPRLDCCRRAADAAFAAAAITRADVDVALVYDPFTIQVVVSLEALGFCAPGDGAAFVRSGGIARGGSLPVNPHGGLLSYAHPGRSGAMLHAVEAVRQLRGECGDRQVAGARVALVAAEGAMLSDHAVTLLGTARP